MRRIKRRRVTSESASMSETSARCGRPFPCGSESLPDRVGPAFLHLLAKPCVMVNVAFHQLLDVFLRTAVVLGSDTVEFRFQVRMAVYFHVWQYEQMDLALSAGGGMPGAALQRVLPGGDDTPMAQRSRASMLVFAQKDRASCHLPRKRKPRSRRAQELARRVGRKMRGRKRT